MAETLKDEPSPETLRKAMELAWRDHHHARDQTWKTVQIVSVLAAGLLSIDFKFESIVATSLGAIPVVLSAGIGAAITWSHRKLERRKIIHIMNCEELLGLHRDDIIPLDIGKEKMADKSDIVRDSAVKYPPLHSFTKIFNPFKHNTSLFIFRIHIAIMLFTIIVVYLRWKMSVL